ncbi:DUF6602 domain-containing protein [Pedobacter soli]|uniref:DUF6602 domain-containing protein n=1 Tax=Pedobacter soli TaxID=390242 RepID=A0A1G6WM91_9SPHI|nr:DUF6602 domain-containing protein [Pedobacter soli]SDD66899.1 hypothetical protein SAMN04488024_10761 [Pedobacter soli]
MLKTHFDAIEDSLAIKAKIPGNSGHPNHKGTPRELFIKEFLKSHLPESCSIGTGEIIDCNSKPGEMRSQHDIIIYKSSYPKLDFGGGVSAFMVESVIATIEIKSTLNEQGVLQAVKAANIVKSLAESFDPQLHNEITNRKKPEDIQNYVIAYDGPDDGRKVYNWIISSHNKLNLINISLPVGRTEKQEINSNSVDGIFVLKKGFILFANQPIYFQGQMEFDKENIAHSWVVGNQEYGNLALLFLILLERIGADSKTHVMYPAGYLKNHQMGTIYVT